MKNKALLLILDGWGVGMSWGGNAITIAQTQNYNKLLRDFPNTQLFASGQSVGLPGHEVGNSEVGHMNIGAGNIVEQDISHINKSIIDGSFYKNEVLTQAIVKSKNAGTALHLMGIVSDGGIHSHIVHLLALIKLCSILEHPNVFIHAFTDGRDSGTYEAIEFITKLQTAIDGLKVGKIATIIGRDLLDRKGNFQKTQKAYEALVSGVGVEEKSAQSAISNAYKQGETDEFISPRIICKDGLIKNNDTVVFFNFRSDRTRQLFQAFLDPKFEKFQRAFLSLEFITFIPYGIELELGLKAKSAFKTISVEKTLGGYISSLNLKQFHIAETEKYAHVTFFINGNRNEPYPGEDRILIPSPQVKSYALKPEMSAEKVKDELIKFIKRDEHHFYICNLANADMVGHTGDFKAAISAVTCLDSILKEISGVCIDEDIPLIITADHGNIEQMVNPADGMIDPEHTKNPVPLLVVSDNKGMNFKDNGVLGNIASTCLQLAQHDIPSHFKESLII